MEITAQERKFLLKEMHTLLNEYDYTYDDYALNQIIDTWADQKAPLIEAFKKHPNYIDGKFLIAFDSDYSRDINKSAIYNFTNWIYVVMKQMSDGIPEPVAKQRDEEGCHWLPNELYWLLRARIQDSLAVKTINQEQADYINNIIPEAHAHNGQKTSRVINRICTYLGYTKHPEWNREFAKYADALSPTVIRRHTVLSLNPLDYLTMSFGNSWASCHTIDKSNKRNMPNAYEGQYSSGTMSYMLDPSSMVLYTVDKSYDGTDYWTQPKINRQMFHCGEEKLVQGRLYPQSHDCDSELYTPYRNIVQAIMAIIWDVPNLWTLKKGSCAASKYIRTYGTHYADYVHFDNCTLSRLQGSENEHSFDVGADPICIECGSEHSTNDNISCCAEEVYYCQDCGRRIYEDDVRWIDGDAYCDNCVSWCDHCECYTRDEVTYVEPEDYYVCEYCLDNYYSYCEDCDDYHYRDNIRWVESVDRCVCDNCLDEYYEKCDDCCEYYPKDNIRYLDGVDKYVCESCAEEYTQCEHCDNYVHNDNIYETIDGTLLCGDCIATCQHCGQVLPTRDMIEIDFEYICPECAEREDEEC